jgi:hypothetical protein
MSVAIAPVFHVAQNMLALGGVVSAAVEAFHCGGVMETMTDPAFFSALIVWLTTIVWLCVHYDVLEAYVEYFPSYIYPRAPLKHQRSAARREKQYDPPLMCILV